MAAYFGTKKIAKCYFGAKEASKGFFGTAELCGRDGIITSDAAGVDPDPDSAIKFHCVVEWETNTNLGYTSVFHTVGSNNGWTAQKLTDKGPIKNRIEYKSTSTQKRFIIKANPSVKMVGFWLLKSTVRNDMNFTFRSLPNVQVIGFDPSYVPAFLIMNEMFKGCPSLKRIYLNERQFEVASLYQKEMFKNCTALEFIQYVSSRPTNGRQDMFTNTPNLMRPSVDEKAYLSESYGGVFQFDMSRCCENPKTNLSCDNLLGGSEVNISSKSFLVCKVPLHNKK